MKTYLYGATPPIPAIDLSWIIEKIYTELPKQGLEVLSLLPGPPVQQSNAILDKSGKQPVFPSIIAAVRKEKGENDTDISLNVSFPLTRRENDTKTV